LKVTIAYIEAMTEAYPNLEIPKFTTGHHVTIPCDDTVLFALCFPKLTSLTLCGFGLGDGAVLLEVNVEVNVVV